MTAREQIKRNFIYHTPDQESIDKLDKLREKAKELALLIDEHCPNSREKSLAMTKLEESNMWANAAIVRN